MIIIKKINYKKTFEIRQPVLRQGMPIESCFFANDEDKSTLHFGLFDNEILLGVISVFVNKNFAFAQGSQYQIRGMAVLQSSQNKGFGRLLIEHVEKAINNKTNLIWMNARENAVPFYKKMNYKTIGKAFEIENVGTHFVMFKELNETHE